MAFWTRYGGSLMPATTPQDFQNDLVPQWIVVQLLDPNTSHKVLAGHLGS